MKRQTPVPGPNAVICAALPCVTVIVASILMSMMCWVVYYGVSNADKVDKVKYDLLIAGYVSLEKDNAQFNSMFVSPMCWTSEYSGHQVVSTNRTILQGGPIVCKQSAGSMCFADQLVDVTFPSPLQSGSFCANSAWKVGGIPYYNVSDVVSDKTFIRCFLHTDGRILRDSCVLHIQETPEPLAPPKNNEWDFIVLFSLGWPVLVLISIWIPVLAEAFRQMRSMDAKSVCKRAFGALKALRNLLPESTNWADRYELWIRAYNLETKKMVKIKWRDLSPSIRDEVIYWKKDYVQFIYDPSNGGSVISKQFDLAECRDISLCGYFVQNLRGKVFKHEASTILALNMETLTTVTIPISPLAKVLGSDPRDDDKTHVRVRCYTFAGGFLVALQTLDESKVPTEHDGTYYSIEDLRSRLALQ